MNEPVQDTVAVRALFDSYLAQDRERAEALIADDFVFTSPQDDHIDRAAFFAQCFPTASRVRHQELLEIASVDSGVFVFYEYELHTGERHRNAEVISVRDGQITEAQVFFGGRVATAR